MSELRYSEEQNRVYYVRVPKWLGLVCYHVLGATLYSISRPKR